MGRDRSLRVVCSREQPLAVATGCGSLLAPTDAIGYEQLLEFAGVGPNNMPNNNLGNSGTRPYFHWKVMYF